MPTTTYPLGSPLGTGIPATADQRPPGASFSRYLDGKGQYVINAETGRYENMPPVRQRLVIALRHLMGSSTVAPDGMRYPKIVSKRTKNELQTEVRRVSRQMTEIEKVMKLEDVIIEPTEWASRVIVTVKFEDLTTGQQDSITFDH